MTRTTVELERGWTMKPYLAFDWAVEAAVHGWDGPGWLPAAVPGSVAHDVWHAGDVASPFVERGSLGLEWVAARAWRYRCAFDVPALDPGDRALLRFAGVDHQACVLVDNTELGRHDGMFTPFDLALPGIAPGRHRLDVIVGPAPPSASQLGRTSDVRIHKSRMTYGWDFCPRLVHQGIWKPVRLEVHGPVGIADVWARPRWTDPSRDAVVDVEVILDGRSGVAPRLRVTLRHRDRPIAAAESAPAPDEATTRLTLVVPGAAPWRPNGLGTAEVHRLTVELIDDAGQVLDSRTVPVGFRDARLVANAGAPADARPYTLEIDGRRVPIRGWNWVPLDVFHGVPRPAHLAHLIRLARGAHVNVLRVWGGGLIEDEAFYDACDEAGILVWQEFALSSSQTDSVPSEDPAYVDLLGREARAIVPSRRNHPSLLLWCGGNELHRDGRPLDETTAPVLATLRAAVADLDPERPFLPTSPSGPRFHNRLEDITAEPDGLWDVHGPWEHQGLDGHNALYDAGTSLLNSEFGVEGMANRRQHEALIGAEHRWPATRANPVYRHLGEWWINEPLVQRAFGGRLRDVDTLRRASQHLQADGLRYAVEANRRRWPRNAGSLPWQLNESFPNAWCTAVVDHRGDPKPAFFAVAHAYAPVHVCASFARWAWADAGPFRADLWAWSSEPRPDGIRVRAAVRLLDGSALAETVTEVDGLGEAACGMGSIEADLPDGLALLDLAIHAGDDAPLAGNRYLVSGTADLAPLLEVEPALVTIERAGSDDAWSVVLTHRAGPGALGLMLDDARPIEEPGWVEAADGCFDLLPGEQRTVTVRWAGAPPGGRRIRVHGWNVDATVE